MVRKHIYHFNRGVVIGLELVGVIALLAFAAWLGLLARLSQGPMKADFLSNALESSLSKSSGMEFHVGSTWLVWGGTEDPFQISVNNVQVNRPDKTPVLFVQKIGIQLSKRYLVLAKVVPRVIKIYSPNLRVSRDTDGHFLFNMQGDAAPTPDTGAGNGSADLMKDFISRLKDSGALNMLAGLEQVAITNATLVYDDRALNVLWKSHGTDLIFTRGDDGLEIDTVANLELDPGHTAYLRSNFTYDWETATPEGVVYFAGINPALLAQQSTALQAIAQVNLPLKGSVALTLDQNFMPGAGRFVIGADAGTFNAAGLYAKPMPVKNMYAQGLFNMATREMSLEDFRLDMDGPKASAKMALTQEGEGHALRVTAILENMQMDILHKYWPETVGVDARKWVVEHLSAGTTTHATLRLSMLAPTADFNSLALEHVGGTIDFKGLKVDYFAPLMPATDVDGRATYDNKSFNIAVTHGQAEDLAVTDATIAITDLDSPADQHAKIDINANLNGPLKTALKLLDGKPLGYPKEMGIDPAKTAGTAAINVDFKFPLYDNLALPEIKVTAKAKIDNAVLPGIVAGMDLTGGPLDVALAAGALTVKGAGKLGDTPLTFSFLKNFNDGAPVAMQADAKMALTPAVLAKFGVPDSLKMTGTLPATATYTVAPDKSATLSLKGDVTPTGFTVPVLNYAKKETVAGALDMTLRIDKNGKLTQIPSLSLTGDKMAMKGNLGFYPDGNVQKADFSQVQLGDTDIALTASNGLSSGFTVGITGKQLDASSFFTDEETPNSDAEAAKPVTPVTLSLNIGKLVTGQEKSIWQLKMFMRRNGWGRIDQLDVDGQAGYKPLSLRYDPTAKGHMLRLEADNAGAALAALGITNKLKDGKIVVNGTPFAKGGSRDIAGTVMLTNFTVVNAPTLGRLLNAMSLTGIMELLNGKGIGFQKMSAGFQWIDRGQPETAKNVRLIRLKDGQTSGASLGLTFEGTADIWTRTLDLNGTIIPASGINKAAANIPLVGNILTGGGKAVFAATYTVKGPKDTADVKVNPLSVLAPGILRKLFFEK